MSKRRQYPKEFKLEAVRKAEEEGFEKVGRDLDINPSLIHKWRRRLEASGEEAFPGKGNPRDEELTRLQRELARVKEENQILKKAVGIFSKSPQGGTHS